ncbi:alpha/beta-hydrolase [Plenodomus tracheiphilus IPT5]|uniref:Carboxylic ester hydrolase n=1 Tax=Plenodomus tracheiphilus IPT5 TaxID=1408161 RepID=A0A6A7BGA6_9PLEO|nr:alpha/beta-hydrolase [Plenodomus tracheiphilus IPT5]
MGIFNTAQRVVAALAICNGVQASHEVSLPGYGRFVGTTISQTLTNKALPATVDAWLGIDFASQPVGEARFAPVGPPAAFDGVKNATQYGLSCVQDPETLPYEQGEACLSMNVFRPQNVSADAKLPILLWIYGGAFVTGSSRSFDGPSFVANAKEPLIVVTFNYRVNSLGFLPTPAFERLGLLNLGLRDQETLFKFVQQYISAFGGDPRRVTIGGRSAGAHSVGIHLFHNYNKTASASPYFSQAILQSGSVTARSFPNASYPLYQAQFTRYLSLIGCNATANTTDTQLLSCLRSTPISAIQKASTTLYNDSKYSITWPFQPTLGGPLLEQRGSLSGSNQQFYPIPIITTNVPDEAKFYSPGNLTTNDHFTSFLHTLLPGLTPTDLDDLSTLYPDPAAPNTTTTTTINNTPYDYSPNSTQYNRISAALTDYMYICPGQETALRMSNAHSPHASHVYKLVFATNNTFPPWQGIPHTADTKYTWVEPYSSNRTIGVQYPDVGALLHAYFANFVGSGDPNLGVGTRRLREEGRWVPVWPGYRDEVGEGREGLQVVIRPFGESGVESDGRRRLQCEWWRDEGRAARLEK